MRCRFSIDGRYESCAMAMIITGGTRSCSMQMRPRTHVVETAVLTHTKQKFAVSGLCLRLMPTFCVFYCCQNAVKAVECHIEQQQVNTIVARC